jgi:hypothetical protein
MIESCFLTILENSVIKFIATTSVSIMKVTKFAQIWLDVDAHS